MYINESTQIKENIWASERSPEDHFKGSFLSNRSMNVNTEIKRSG
jgi:hypothetical protein